MKKLVLVAVLVMGFSIMAMAQDTPAVEVYGGYSYLRLNPPSDIDSKSINMNGWNAGAAFNGNKYLGFVVNFSGNYGSMDMPDEALSADFKIHTVMFGPKFTARKGKVTSFLQTLFGVARLTGTAADQYLNNQDIVSENDFAMSVGGGVDVNLNNSFALRPVQIDYVAVKYGLTGDFLKNFQYSAGIVLKLGKR